MDHRFKELLVLREAAENGDGTVLQITTNGGTVIHAISVAREGFSYTGPTWTYLFESDGITLIDAGEAGSHSRLEDGLKVAGFSPKDIDRVIITHGHEDHDGAVAELVDKAGVEVWAHEIYAHLQAYDPRSISRRAISPIQKEMWRVAEVNGSFPPTSPQRDEYVKRRQTLRIDHPIKANETVGRLEILHTPGHSPDELCMKLDEVVFTGDHVLPEISPHPTMKVEFPPDIKAGLPDNYKNADNWYGLARYLQSLKMIVDLGSQWELLPAHRYYNRGHFNFINTERAATILDHHGQRLTDILEKVGGEAVNLENLTRGIFAHRELLSDNLLAGLSEVVAHIEILEDLGDLEVAEDGIISATGQSNHLLFLSELQS